MRRQKLTTRKQQSVWPSGIDKENRFISDKEVKININESVEWPVKIFFLVGVIGGCLV